MANADVIATLEALKRRKELLGVQQKMNMETPIVGNTGLGQLAAKLGTAFLLKKADGKYTADDTAARGKYSDQLKQEAGTYLDKFQGSPGVDLPSIGMTNVGGLKPNPREAVVNAMTSQLPEIQQLGKSGMAELLARGKKEGLSPKDILSLAGYDPRSKVTAAMTGDISGLAPDANFMVVGNQLVNTREAGGSDGIKPVFDGREQYSEPYKIGSDLYQRETRLGGKVNKLDNAPKTNVTVNAPAGETAFSRTLGEGTAKAVLEARTQAESAYKMKGVVKQLEELESKGVYNTPVPNLAIGVGNFAQALGIPVDRSKLANSEAFQQQIAKQVADVLTAGGGVGRSMTDEDRKAFAMSLPQLLMTPEGRRQVYGMMNAAADTTISRNTSMQEALKNNPMYKDHPGMLTFNPVDQTPGPGAIPPQPPVVPSRPAGSGGVMKLGDYLKSKGG